MEGTSTRTKSGQKKQALAKEEVAGTEPEYGNEATSTIGKEKQVKGKCLRGEYGRQSIT